MNGVYQKYMCESFINEKRFFFLPITNPTGFSVEKEHIEYINVNVELVFSTGSVENAASPLSWTASLTEAGQKQDRNIHQRQ